MVPSARSFLLASVCAVAGSGPAWAAPITFQASGQVSHLVDDFGALSAIDIGTPWLLELTFDSEASGHQPLPTLLPTTYLYSGAIDSARFQLGQFVYTNTDGDIATNYGLPVGNGVSSASGQGLVQFQWVTGWSGGAGGPDLNQGVGLMLASYNDLSAVDGSLPSVANPNPVQSAMSGLLWDASLGTPPFAQFSSDFSPTGIDPSTVPEPGTLLLVGAGMAAFAARRRAARRAD